MIGVRGLAQVRIGARLWWRRVGISGAPTDARI